MTRVKTIKLLCWNHERVHNSGSHLPLKAFAGGGGEGGGWILFVIARCPQDERETVYSLSIHSPDITFVHVY